MFEVAELGRKTPKKEYEARVPELRTGLLAAQQKLIEANFPVLILISGVDGGGKGDVLRMLNEWMDPRYMQSHAFGEPTEDERERPPHWRFWMALPSSGLTGIFIGSWYSDPLSLRVQKKIDDADLDARLARINLLERELCDDGTLIIKCWLHLSKKFQKQKIKKLEKDPHTAWLVTARDKKHLKYYDQFCVIAERVLRETSTGRAPWLIVDGSDIKYSSLTVGNHILTQIEQRLAQPEAAAPAGAKPTPPLLKEPGILQSLDVSKSLEKKAYKQSLGRQSARLSELARKAREKKRSTILVFEGWDAGGKGGAIRRITHALDPRGYRVIPVAAPTDEEKAHHYLWRFWRHIPRRGQFTIYDRSWYGRVLVERVEGFAPEEDWLRAYQEINEFEEELTDFGIIIMKFWLHIDQDEQLRRFKEREQISYKQHKITEEDYRNREQWSAYEAAVDDMVTRTSTSFAPWHLIPANDKRYARVQVMKTVCDTLKDRL